MAGADDYNKFRINRENAKASAAASVIRSLREINPDQKAKATTIAGVLGVPDQIYEQNPAHFDAMIEERYNKELLRRSPRLADAMLADPRLPALAHDDLQNLSKIEQDTGALGRAVGRGVRSLDAAPNTFSGSLSFNTAMDIGKTREQLYDDYIKKAGPDPSLDAQGRAMQMAADRYDFISTLDETDKEAMLLGAAEQLAIARDKLDVIANSPKSETAQPAVDGFAKATTAAETLAVLKDHPIASMAFLAETAAEFLPVMGVAGGTTMVAGPEAGAAVLAAGSFAVNTQDELMSFLSDRKVDLSSPEAARAALRDPTLMSEAIQRGVQYGLMVAIFDAASGGAAGRSFGIANKAGRAAVDLTVQASLGAAGEAAGQAVARGEITWRDVILEGLAETITAPIEAGSMGRAWLKDSQSAKTAQARRDMFTAISDSSKASKLRGRMPAAYGKFVDAVTKNGPVATLYVPAKNFVEYFQSQGVDPAGVASSLGLNPDVLSATVDAGGDLSIPTATYAEKVAGSKHDTFFMDNMRTAPDEMTFAEAKDYAGKKAALAAEAMSEAQKAQAQAKLEQSATDAMFQRVKSALVAAGRTSSEAETNAAVYPAFFTALSERAGMTPEQLMDRIGLPRIQGELSPVAEDLATTPDLPATLAELRTAAEQPDMAPMMPEARMTAIKDYLDQIGADLSMADDEIAALIEGDTGSVESDGKRYAQELVGIGSKIDSPAFKAWFGDSRVVDAGGKPLVVYHGGASGIEAFSPDRIGSARGQDSEGFFFTTSRGDTIGSADDYAKMAERDFGGGEVYSAYLSISNPYTIEQYANDVGATVEELTYYGGDLQSPIDVFDNDRAEIMSRVREGGYDGVIFDYGREAGNDEALYVALQPTQIKSTNNVGTFDANDPRILFQSGVPMFDNPLPIDGKVTVRAIGEAMNNDHMAQHGRQLFPEDSEEDYQTVLGWMGDEMRGQLKQPNSGVGWYTKDVQLSMELASRVYPTLATNPTHRDLFLVFAGLFSNGAEPEGAFMNSAEAFETFLATGEIAVVRADAFRARGEEPRQTSFKDRKTGEEVSKDAGWGIRNPANEQQLAFVKWIVEREGGIDEGINWLRTKRPRTEINAAMIDSGLYKAGRYTTKAEIAGPDAHGIMVFGEKLGRYTMGLHGVDIDAGDTTIDLWYSRTYRRLTGRLLETPVGPEGVVGGPTEKDRQVIFRLTGDLVKQFDLPAGDVQAVLWFWEKRLWGAQGLRTSEGTNSSGAQKLLRSKGLDDGAGSDGSSVGAGSKAAGKGKAAAGRTYGQGAVNEGRPEQGGDGRGRQAGGSLAPLEGAPTVEGASGPDARLVSVAEGYAQSIGLTLARQSEFVEVDPERGARIAAAYEAMEDNPQDPAVKEAYQNLIEQTVAQYRALEAAGYQFWFIDIENDGGYADTPWNAMRDLRANQRMGVFPTTAGYGTGDVTFDVEANPMLADTGIEWSFGGPDGPKKPVLANDLFRAVHDAFGHGLEGAGFRARGEENAWQAHVRLFTGSAVAAITSETRGQNSWLNFGPHGEANRTAKVEDTIFAEQKIGLMPSWTWEEGRAGDMPTAATVDVGGVSLPLNQDGTVTLYHGTTAAAAAEIARTGILKSAGEPSVYLTTAHSADTGYGDGTVVAVDVMPDALRIDDEFPDGRADFAIDSKSVRVVRSSVMSRTGPLLFQNMAGTNRGAITLPVNGLGKGETIIRLFASADLSTFMHESGHFFLSAIQALAADPQATPEIRAMYQTVKDWWLDNAGAVAADGTKVTGTKVTAEDVLNALANGTSGDRTVDLAIDIGMQEQWARAFEVYLLEGKSPSAELQSVFSRMAAWLKLVYQSALRLNVNVSDELRTVFDRMLATDQQMQATQDDMADAPLFESAEQAGMTPDEFKVLLKLHEDARGQMMADLLEKTMAPIRRQRMKSWKEERVKVEAEVRKDVASRQVYAAITALRFGRNVDGEDLDPPVKISRDAIKQAYPSVDIGKLAGATKDGKGHRTAVFSTDEGGLHPDIVASMFGYETGGDLLLDLATAPDMETVIKQETDAAMAARYPDPMTDGTVADEAVKALHNDKRAAAIERELAALTKMAGEDKPLTAKQARAIAEATVKAMPVKTASKPAAFLAAERRAAREAIRLSRLVGKQGVRAGDARQAVRSEAKGAVKAGEVKDPMGMADTFDASNAAVEGTGKRAGFNDNLAELIAAKRQQLLNHMLYNEARKIEAKVDSTIAKTAKLNGSDKKLTKARDINHVKAARAIAAKFGLARGDTSFDFAMWIEQLAVDDPLAVSAMVAAIETYGQDAKPYGELTVSEFGAVVDAIDSVLEVGKALKKAEIDGKAQDRDQIIGELTTIAASREKGRELGETRRLTKGEKRGIRLISFRASLIRAEAWARDMDDGGQGPFNRYIIKPVQDALGRYRDDRVVRMQELLAILNPRRKELLGAAINAPELGYSFENKGELLHAILHTGNDSNLQKLLIGRGWSTGFVNRKQKMTAAGKPSVNRQGVPIMDKGVLDTEKWDAFMARMFREGIVTKEDIDTAVKIWRLMDSTKRPAQTAHKRIYGYYFGEIEPRMVDTPWGPVQGGYVPAIGDRLASTDAGRRQADAALEANAATSMFPTTGSGFTKGRVEQYTTPLELNLMLLPSHLDKVLRFTHLEPIIRQTGAIVNDRGFRAAMQNVDPKIIDIMVIPWLQRAASQTVETKAANDGDWQHWRLWATLRRRAGISTMFANVVNTAQQITGLSTAALLVKPARLASSLTGYLGSPVETRERVMEASAYMRNRMGNQSQDLARRIEEAVVAPTIPAELEAFVTKHGYFLQTAFQNVMDPIIWTASYDQGVAGGMTHEQAVFEADSVIRRTQADMAPENVSSFEAGSPFARLFSMFYSYFNAQANLVGGEMATAVRTLGWNGKSRYAFIYAFGIAIPAIAAEAIVQAARGELGDEDDDGWTDDLLGLFLGSQVRYVTAFLPFIGNITNAVVGRFTSAFYDDRLSTSAAVSFIERAASAPYSVVQAVQDPKKAGRAVGDTATLLALLFGIPAGQFAKTTGFAIDAATGKQKPEGAVDVTRGLVTGRVGP